MKSVLLSLAFVLATFGLIGQNIGINTPTPLKTFSVNGSIGLDHSSKNYGTLDSASLVFGLPPATVGLSSNKNLMGVNPKGLDIWTNNLKRLSILENGNIGIGTTSPVSKFQIGTGSDVSLISNGFMMLGTESNLNVAFDNNEIQARNNGAASRLFMQNTGGDTQIGATTENNIRIDGTNIQAYYNGSVGELVLQGLINGGKTRIGTGLDFATTKFHISTGVDAGLSAANSGFMMIGLSTGPNLVFDNNEILARDNGAASTLYLARDASTVQLGNGATVTGTKLHITSGSEVGLTDAQSGHLMMGAQSANNMIFDANEIQARNNGAASPLFMQYSGGNVALGPITPTTQLHMTGNFTMQSAAPVIQMTNNAGTDMGFLQVENNDVRIGTNATNDLGNFIVRTNGTNRIYVNPSGSVSIGTSTPATGYMLSVNGKAMVEELKVQLSQNWPDYVFSNKYKLKTFDELREYIAENNHLPNIPSAKEVETSGLEVGEMQRKMMEKIEELTLYVLQLENRIKELKK
ncbi:MAG: hypothetical protein V4683_15285 [Bacteroidota bacterium]